MAFFYKFLVILILFNMEGIFKREKGKMEKIKPSTQSEQTVFLIT